MRYLNIEKIVEIVSFIILLLLVLRFLVSKTLTREELDYEWDLMTDELHREIPVKGEYIQNSRLKSMEGEEGEIRKIRMEWDL